MTLYPCQWSLRPHFGSLLSRLPRALRLRLKLKLLLFRLNPRQVLRLSLQLLRLRPQLKLGHRLQLKLRCGLRLQLSLLGQLQPTSLNLRRLPLRGLYACLQNLSMRIDSQIFQRPKPPYADRFYTRLFCIK